MRKYLTILLACIIALSISACGLLPEKIDETASWPAGKLYREAKEELNSGNYEKAVEYFEKLEARYPFGIYAQQAQMDIAYAYYRQNEQAQALAAAERFIKLHPNHPNIDYMYYLKGLINFNDRLGLLNFAFRQDLSERDPKAAQDAFDAFKVLKFTLPNIITGVVPIWQRQTGHNARSRIIRNHMSWKKRSTSWHSLTKNWDCTI